MVVIEPTPDLAVSTETLFESPYNFWPHVMGWPTAVARVHVCSPFFMPRGLRRPLIKLPPNYLASPIATTTEAATPVTLTRVPLSVPQF